MRMLTGASQRLAKRHSATVRSPAPSHTHDIDLHTHDSDLIDVHYHFTLDAPPTPRASEYKREFRFGVPGNAKFPGLRSEEMITVGQYTPVLRSIK